MEPQKPKTLHEILTMEAAPLDIFLKAYELNQKINSMFHNLYTRSRAGESVDWQVAKVYTQAQRGEQLYWLSLEVSNEHLRKRMMEQITAIATRSEDSSDLCFAVSAARHHGEREDLLRAQEAYAHKHPFLGRVLPIASVLCGAVFCDAYGMAGMIYSASNAQQEQDALMQIEASAMPEVKKNVKFMRKWAKATGINADAVPDEPIEAMKYLCERLGEQGLVAQTNAASLHQRMGSLKERIESLNADLDSRIAGPERERL